MGRPWHETVAISGITIAGIFEALQQASKDAPAMSINLSGAWNYLPLAALIVGAVAWAYGRLTGAGHGSGAIALESARDPREPTLDRATKSRMIVSAVAAVVTVSVMAAMMLLARYVTTGHI